MVKQLGSIIMKSVLKYFLNGLMYFMLQTLLETALIVVLMYMGISYSEIIVGGEPLCEIIIGILGYHAMFKSIMYSWIYLLIFVTVAFIVKPNKQVIFCYMNGVLSLLLPIVILLLRGLTVLEMANVFIATLLASAIIIGMESITYRWSDR
jgi:hypothetical protein